MHERDKRDMAGHCQNMSRPTSGTCGTHPYRGVPLSRWAKVLLVFSNETFLRPYDNFDMVPISRLLNRQGVAGVGYAFALCRQTATIKLIKEALGRALHPSRLHRFGDLANVKNNVSARSVQFWQRKNDRRLPANSITTDNNTIQKDSLRTKWPRKNQCFSILQNIKNFRIGERYAGAGESKPDSCFTIWCCVRRTVAFDCQRKLIIIADQRECGRFNSAPISCNSLCQNRSFENITSRVLNFPTRNLVRPSQPRHKSQQRNNFKHVHTSPQNQPSVLKRKGQEVEL